MIGGYIHSERDHDLDLRIQRSLDPKWTRIEIGNRGYFFYSDPFKDESSPYLSSPDLTALSEDLLVCRNGDSGYQPVDLARDFAPAFGAAPSEAFNSIHSDFRMAVAMNRSGEFRLYLASNRAGSGRIYYCRLKDAIVFCSDLRFLLKVVPFNISRKAIYAILKYGSVPEPLTICENVSAVPPATTSNTARPAAGSRWRPISNTGSRPTGKRASSTRSRRSAPSAGSCAIPRNSSDAGPPRCS